MAGLLTMTHRNTLIVVNNALDYSHDETESTTKTGNNLFDLVRQVYPKGLPLNTSLYHEKWDLDCDVTPTCETDIDKINSLSGVFYLVTYPSAALPVWAIAAASVAASVAVAFLMPMTDVNIGNTTQPPSPNNALGQRTNKQRYGGRVPEIFGEVRSVPDLIAPTYSVYIDHEEVEYSWMCVGRGYYNVKKALDNLSDIDYLLGTTVEIFNPNRNIRSTPDKRFGRSYTPRELDLSRLVVKRYSAVNGQTLESPDVIAKNNNQSNMLEVFFWSDNIEVADTASNIDGLITAGDIVNITVPDVQSASGGNTYKLSGKYKVGASSDKHAKLTTLDNNESFLQLVQLADTTEFVTATLSAEKEIEYTDADESEWVGPFYTNDPESRGLLINLIAPNGIYERHPKEPKYLPLGVAIETLTEEIDENNNVIPNTQKKSYHTIEGRHAQRENGEYIWTTKDSAMQTACLTRFIYSPGRQRIYFRRITKQLRSSLGPAAAQDVKIKDLYTYRLINDNDMPKDVTTVYAKTLATEGALSIKERKLMLDVQRYVKDSGANENGLILSNRIDDIIYHIATDPVTSVLTKSDLNLEQIKSEVDAQIEYFGTDLCARFCGTFDNTKITTEEMIQTVAQAGFFTAYRLNNKIHLSFERPDTPAVVTFNSHNILPDSFEYSETFGPRNDYDGMHVTYIDPKTNMQASLFYPPDRSATNPQKVDLIGVRNKVQAHMHMMRMHWKNQRAYSTCTFTGADETGVIIPTNKIKVANQLRADTQQGVVLSIEVVNGKTALNLSKDVDFNDKAQATIFVQTVNASVDNIRCTPGDRNNQVVLARPPVQPLSTSADAVVKSTYQFVTHTDSNRDTYIVTTKDPGNRPLTNKLTCVNFADYYSNDFDYKKGLVTK